MDATFTTPTRVLVGMLCIAGIVASGACGRKPAAGDRVMTDTRHSHYHVHGPGIDHGHVHADFTTGGHTHAHDGH